MLAWGFIYEHIVKRMEMQNDSLPIAGWFYFWAIQQDEIDLNEHHLYQL